MNKARAVGVVAVLRSYVQCKDGIAPCNHEETDTRIFIHIAHAAGDGLLKAIIHTVDTDVVILAIANVHKIHNLDELWIAFGTGKN